jgi:hypothetical protein
MAPITTPGSTNRMGVRPIVPRRLAGFRPLCEIVMLVAR